MRVNAMTEKFEDVTVLGHPMLFTCLRVDRDTVPQGMYMYEVRHDDDQQGEPVQIDPFAWSPDRTGETPTATLILKTIGTMRARLLP